MIQPAKVQKNRVRADGVASKTGEQAPIVIKRESVVAVVARLDQEGVRGGQRILTFVTTPPRQAQDHMQGR